MLMQLSRLLTDRRAELLEQLTEAGVPEAQQDVLYEALTSSFGEQTLVSEELFTQLTRQLVTVAPTMMAGLTEWGEMDNLETLATVFLETVFNDDGLLRGSDDVVREAFNAFLRRYIEEPPAIQL